VQFKVDGVNLGSEDTSAPYSVVWDTVASGVGPHQLTAVARDAAGNSAPSPIVNVTVSSGSSGGPTPVSDSFTGATGSMLVGHTPEIGSGWVDTQAALRILNNKLEGVNFGDARSYNAAAIGTADYDVTADLTMNVTGWGNRAGVRGRDAGGRLGNAYEAYYNEGTGTWRLDKWFGFGLTNLGSFTQAFPAGTTKTIRLSMRGSTITVYVDGVARITVTDASVAGPGAAGIFMAGGIHDGILLDNFVVTK